MLRHAFYSLATSTLFALVAGCGDSPTPTTSEQSTTPQPTEESTASQPAAVDMTPVLPIPDDVPANSEGPTTATIKPIPDDQ